MIQTGQFRSRQNFWAQPAPQNRDANSIVLRDECARIAHWSGSCPASAFGWRLGTSQELGCAALTRIELEHCSILRLAALQLGDYRSTGRGHLAYKGRTDALHVCSRLAPHIGHDNSRCDKS